MSLIKNLLDGFYMVYVFLQRLHKQKIKEIFLIDSLKTGRVTYFQTSLGTCFQSYIALWPILSNDPKQAKNSKKETENEPKRPKTTQGKPKEEQKRPKTSQKDT